MASPFDLKRVISLSFILLFFPGYNLTKFRIKMTFRDLAGIYRDHDIPCFLKNRLLVNPQMNFERLTIANPVHVQWCE